MATKNIVPRTGSQGGIGTDAKPWKEAIFDTGSYGVISSSLKPDADNTYDLGSSGNEWKDLYIDGTANIDSLAMGTTVTSIADEDDLSSNSATALATQQSIKAYVDTQLTAEDLDVSSDSGTIAITSGTAQYDLPADTIDLLDQVIRTNAGNTSTQSDLTISRIGVSTYSSIPNKLTTGRPIQVFIERLITPRINLWPVPDQSYTFVYFRMRRIQDAGSGVESADVVFRFLPCLVAGLAYHIAMKVPELMGRIDMLKKVYDEQYALAAGEDREKTSENFIPRIGRI